jgi:hypothetical protein
MNRIHFIGGEKGGVGKSVMARVLAQYYIDRQVAFQVFDADLSHGAMLRYYADFATPLDLNKFESADQIVEQTVEKELNTIVDLAAQSTTNLDRWVNETGVLELAEELGLSLTFWHVMDDGADSLHLLQDRLDNYADKMTFVVVRNYGRGSDFAHFARSKTAAQLQEQGAMVIDLPGLHPPTMRKIDHISASFWAAANNNDPSVGPSLGLLERQRVKTWLHKTYTQLDRVHA